MVMRVLIGYARFRCETQNGESENLLKAKKIGVTEKDLNTCRVETVSSDGFVDNKRVTELACAICTDDFVPNDLVRVLPCNSTHIFHKDCIDPWLRKSGKCPLCVQSILKN